MGDVTQLLMSTSFEREDAGCALIASSTSRRERAAMYSFCVIAAQTPGPPVTKK
jgi:hypothetical protein